jgi:hypothetical protein
MSTLPYFPTPASPEQMTEGPDAVQLIAAGPARQGRLTVFFRLLMAIPQGIVLGFLAIAALVVAFIGWWAALFTGDCRNSRRPTWLASSGGSRGCRRT